MYDTFPSKHQAIQYLKATGCSEEVVSHCIKVAEQAREIAHDCIKNGLNVNLLLVEVGAILHDIGCSKSHSIDHVIVGAKIAKTLKVPEPVISIIKKHVGGGIAYEEAIKLKWPKDVYIPKTIEEKIVSIADKLTEGNLKVSIETKITKYSNNLSVSSLKRVRKLHNEILKLTGMI